MHGTHCDTFLYIYIKVSYRGLWNEKCMKDTTKKTKDLSRHRSPTTGRHLIAEFCVNPALLMDSIEFSPESSS